MGVILLLADVLNERDVVLHLHDPRFIAINIPFQGVSVLEVLIIFLRVLILPSVLAEL